MGDKGTDGAAGDAPMLTLFRSFEPEELKTTEFYIYDTTDEDHTERQLCSLPIFDGTNREVLLYLVTRLREVAQENQFEDKHYWKHFPKALRDSAKAQWSQKYDEIADDAYLDLEQFNETLDGFIAIYFPAGSRNLIFQGMLELKTQGTRPAGFSATRLFTRLTTMRLEAMHIPSEHDEQLNDNALKNIAYNMLRTGEQVQILRKYNNDITTATLGQLMQDVRNEEYIQGKYKEQKSQRKSNKKRKGNSSPTQNNGNGHNNGHNNGRNNNNNNDNNSKRGKRRTKDPTWGPNAKCRLHPEGNHLWRDCNQNPRNKQNGNNQQRGNEQRQGNNRNGNNNRNSGYGGPTHQGHYYMQQASTPPQQGPGTGMMPPAYAYFGMPPPPPSNGWSSPLYEGAFTHLFCETSQGTAVCHDAAVPACHDAAGSAVCHDAAVPACHGAAADSQDESTANCSTKEFAGYAADNREVSAESGDFHHLDSPCFHFDYDEQEIVLAMDRELPFDPLCYMSKSTSIFPESSPQMFEQHNIETNETYHLRDEDFAKEALEEVSPTGLMTAQRIQDQPSHRLLKVLFDTGSEKTFVHSRSLPAGATPTLLDKKTTGTTLAGTFEANRYVRFNDLVLPEFGKDTKIDGTAAYVFDTPCPYDVILGCDVLRPAGIDIKFSTRTVEWMGKKTPMKPKDYWKGSMSYVINLVNGGVIADDDEDELLDLFATDIQEAKYEKADPGDVARQQKHLEPEQQEQLEQLFRKHDKLFSGELGRYPHRKLHLDLKETDETVRKRQRAYGIPRQHHQVFKDELEHLCKIGVLERTGASEWQSPTFIVPKKDGRVRWVSDFRELNKIIRRRSYPLPRIQEILQRRTGYEYFTKIDISMQYYTFELDDESKDLCTIATPFGLYRYCRLPMGVSCSPDFAQEIMEDIFHDLEEVEVYIDDVGAFDNSWSAHLATLEKVLQRLEDNNFTVNPLKCEWAVKETDWLGHWLTPTGLKPWKKKIQAILDLQPPTNLKQLRSFIGAINYYRDMFPRRSHLMAPLTTATSKFEWGPAQTKAFNEVKALIAEDCLCRYPDPNKPFHVYTDASDYQLGAVIMQEGLPVAYYSRKLNDAQRNYTTIEKELLSVVETFREFRDILYGAPELHVHTDHRNLTYATLNSQRVIRWRLFIEEFGPKFHYIKGEDNCLADAFSRVPTQHSEILQNRLNLPPSDDSFFSILDDEELLECFLNYPDPAHIQSPLDYQLIQQEQTNDQELQALRLAEPHKFPTQLIDGYQLVCCITDPQQPWRIAIPTSMITDIVRWHHQFLNHIGMTNLLDTISTHFWHPELKQVVHDVVSPCDACQRYKLSGPAYGELPPREAQVAPWNEVAVDLIGPWKIPMPNGTVYKFSALTCIDPVTNLTELKRIDNKTSEHVTMLFENEWLARYPRPTRCVHDNGGEFTGFPFQRMLELNHIKDVPTTSENPQANAVCERMHQTVGNILRTLIHVHRPQNYRTAKELIDTALATAMHSLRSSVNRSLQMTPGAVVFQRDMLLNIPLIADLHAIRERRQVIIDESLRRANNKRRSHDYDVNELVMLIPKDVAKLSERALGPFQIRRVHANGTVTIQVKPTVTKRVNIRRIKPYRSS